ncbi:AAA family ATPase [Allobacillus sp. GCM10007489]|uniref:AAA family ATPase n=1 Tax=unclassified Allobacillus TaxID=2628859 RepID=UPI002103B734|nr:AAA family ATPase [Allobacillus sp. SKP2-8]
MSSNKLPWITFYMEFADRLLNYKNNRQELLRILRNSYDKLNLKYPFTDKGEPIDDMCPFTVFGSFNKGITDNNRYKIANEIGSQIGVSSPAPENFDGIPVLNNLRSWFFAYKKERGNNDISNLWDLFEIAIQFSEDQSESKLNKFVFKYDQVKDQLRIKWNITMGLYWIRPNSYLNLDGKNRQFLLDNEIFGDSIRNISRLRKVPDANQYLNLVSYLKDEFNKEDSPFKSFPELSLKAWNDSQNEQQNASDLLRENAPYKNTYANKTKRKYWIYSPGKAASKWEEFYSKGILGIGWDKLGDLKNFSSKEDMKKTMKSLYGSEFTYTNAAHATWQFANEMEPGDIVFAKKGRSKVIGRGIVKSEYFFDSDREDFKHIRKIEWLNNGVWDHPGQAVNKALTNISPYIDYVQKLEDLFINEDDRDSDEVATDHPPYTKDDFLNEVFIDEKNYDRLVKLLEEKKNIILQGAPGVGKTFAAKRLAYSMMNEKDDSRLSMIQFHQSYSYEDFIMGYRPTETGFELTKGAFYNLCKKAETDSERKYFFIIDEINRGNLSKIFGELMMLIENDKRGEELLLLYENELFSVPENLYIIGMMNTADRSLAMIDYALRRRFAFYRLEPAFESNGFKKIVEQANNHKLNSLIEVVKSLNSAIAQDESLGSGFKIGHSYLLSTNYSSDSLDSTVEHELIPLLDEYWFDEPEKVNYWSNQLRGALND